MSQVQKEIQQIELTIEAAKEKVALHQTLERLQQNADFRNLVEERYLKNRALRLVELKSRLTTDNQRADLDRELDAISYLNRYFMLVAKEGMDAQEALDDNQRELDSIRGEEEV